MKHTTLRVTGTAITTIAVLCVGVTLYQYISDGTPSTNPRVELISGDPPQISLAWQKGDNISIVGYRVYVQLNDAPFQLYKTLLREETVAFSESEVYTTLSGLQLGNTYRAVVTAYNNIGESPASEAVTFQPELKPLGKSQTIVAIGYNGQLQRSDDLQNWQNVASPHQTNRTTTPRQFYRIQYE